MRNLPGVLAIDSGKCPRCKEQIIAGHDRIVYIRGWAIHIKCHKGKEF